MYEYVKKKHHEHILTSYPDYFFQDHFAVQILEAEMKNRYACTWWGSGRSMESVLTFHSVFPLFTDSNLSLHRFTDDLRATLHASAWFRSGTMPYTCIVHCPLPRFYFATVQVGMSCEACTCHRSKDQSGYLTDQLWDLKSSTPKVLKEARRCESVLRALFPFFQAPAMCRRNAPSVRVCMGISFWQTPQVLQVHSSFGRAGKKARNKQSPK